MRPLSPGGPTAPLLPGGPLEPRGPVCKSYAYECKISFHCVLFIAFALPGGPIDPLSPLKPFSPIEK